MHWYAESEAVQHRLYETPAGNDLLMTELADVQLAATRLLGRDVAATIGPERVTELLARWPGNADLLVRGLTVRGGPVRTLDHDRRRELVAALTQGLADGAS